MPKPNQYIAIALWGENLRSRPYYIEREQQCAARQRAPLDALFQDRKSGAWICVSNLAPDHEFRKQYAEAGGVIPAKRG